MKPLFYLLIICSMPSAYAQTTWSKVGAEYNIDPVILYAVALKESRKWQGRGGSTPWPWTLNAGKGYTFDSREEAATALTKHIDSGRKNIDVGMMQINLKYNGHRVDNPSMLLDPIVNIRVAAEILAENIKRSKGDLLVAIGNYYNPDPVKGRKYATHVLSMASKIKNTSIEKQLIK